MSTARHYLVNLFAQIGSRILSMGSGFLIFVLIARIMGGESLGDLAFVMAFILIAGIIGDMGTIAALGKDLVLEKEKNPEIYFGNYLILRAGLAVIAVLLAVPLISFIKPELLDLLLIASIAVPFVGTRFLETVYQVYEKPQYTIYSSFFLAFIQLSIAIPLLFWIKVDLYGYLVGFAVTQVSYFIFAMFLATRLIVPRFSLKLNIIRSIIVVAAPLGIWSLFNGLSSRLDIFMLSYWRSSQEMGLYNAAYRLLDLAVVVAATASVPLVPVLSRLLKEKGEEAKVLCKRLLEMTVVVLLPIPFVVFFLAEDLVLFLYGKEFFASVEVLQLFAVMFIFFTTIYLSAAINLASDNIRHSWWSAGIATGINAVANYYLIPELGIMGAAIATFISTLFIVLISFYYVNQSLSGAFELGRWLRILGVLLSMFVAVYLFHMKSTPILVLIILTVYILMVWLLKLLPLGLFRNRLN